MPVGRGVPEQRRDTMMRRNAVRCLLAGAIGVTLLAAPVSAQAVSVTPDCLSIPNQEVPVAITLAPGETIQINHNAPCSGSGYFLGIRKFGAQYATSPLTAGIVESSLNGSTWTVVTSDPDQDNTASFVVRYTAPTNGATTDSFYVIAAAYGAVRAGYLYTVTVASPSASGPDLTVWHQAVGRSSGDAACPSGYGGSWAQWPNESTGGWVCVRDVWAYSPESRPPL